MKNIKLFEDFLNERVTYDNEGIIDMLIDGDAMEMDPEEFSDYMLDEFGMMVVQSLELLDEYWSLGAKDRFNFNKRQWSKWLDKLDLE